MTCETQAERGDVNGLGDEVQHQRDVRRQREVVRRMRAARAYAGLSQHELGEMLGLSVATIRRMEGGDRQIRPAEYMAIARGCGVPEAFIAGVTPLDAISEGSPPGPVTAALEKLIVVLRDEGLC